MTPAIAAPATNVVSFADYFDENLPCVRPGKYQAVYQRHEPVRLFEAYRLRVDMQIVEHPDITLSRWYRIASMSKTGRIYATRHSEIVRELSAVCGRRVRTNMVPVTLLRNLVVLVDVYTVTRNYIQKPIDEVNQYSNIRQLIARVDR